MVGKIRLGVPSGAKMAPDMGFCIEPGSAAGSRRHTVAATNRRHGRSGVSCLLHRPEAFEIMQFYHGVVSPRQSNPFLLQTLAFLCGAKTRVLYSSGRNRFFAAGSTWLAAKNCKFEQNLFKTKAKGVKQ
jgi:hypothetical protein